MQEKAPVLPRWLDAEKFLKILAVALYVGVLFVPYAVSSTWRAWIDRGGIYSDPPLYWHLAVVATILLMQLSWIYRLLQRSRSRWHAFYVGVSVLTMTLVLSGFLLEPSKWFPPGYTSKEELIAALGMWTSPLLLLLSIFFRSHVFKGVVVMVMPFSIAAALLVLIVPAT